MSDKRRRRSFFDKFPDDEDFRDIEEIIEHMMEKFGIDLDNISKQPFFYAFAISKRPGEEPEIREFGNIPDYEDDVDSERQQVRIEQRSPLIDIFEIDDMIHVIAELPGIDKSDIEVSATESSMELRASNEEQKYCENIELPVTVDPDTAKANYRNGVLEVILTIKDFGNKRLVQID
ncbi:archaeal heat shock protein Hsp20 [Methanolobus halotolerans]|uniref:Hsp20/alpha crystallin family protein n=1 Tax=Methanolobus halotolerans TaxID=2052935 RepID=A0A4E0PYP8_9EURY|nr:archaeal heat shock protein Hsp20 [Methanolobus halotolerans]TGC11462.1 Hsp20/alpha crystallin family protein [Methanolobus halotolerans]